MNRISFSDFKRLTVEQISEEGLMPMIMTVNGEDTWYIGDEDSIIVLSDLHPNVKIMLRNMELKARAGMPQPVRL